MECKQAIDAKSFADKKIPNRDPGLWVFRYGRPIEPGYGFGWYGREHQPQGDDLPLEIWVRLSGDVYQDGNWKIYRTEEEAWLDLAKSLVTVSIV